MSEISSTPANTNEISFRELVIQTKLLFRYFLQQWKFLLLLAVIGAAVSFYRSSGALPTYTAEVTFIVEDGKSPAMAGYAGLAAQFGVDLGGGASNLYEGNNLTEFLKSRLIIQKVLLTPYTANSGLSLADVYFELSGLKGLWDKNPRTQNIHFPPGKTDFTLIQDSAIRSMRTNLINDAFLKIESVKKTSLLKIAYTSSNEYFAWNFVNRLVQEATDFYVQSKTKRSQLQVNTLQQKSDSLLTVLNRKYYNAAITQDLNPNPARKLATVGVELSTLEKSLAQTMYAEVVKNLEIARSALAQDMPNIQIIDRPTLPLIKTAKNKLYSMILWSIAFFVVGLVLLTIRKFLRSMSV